MHHILDIPSFRQRYGNLKDIQTYGNNGFKLDFRQLTGTSGNHGQSYDYSGNGNNFSPDNFGGTTDE